MKGRESLEKQHSNQKKKQSKKRDRAEAEQVYHYPPKSRPIEQLKFEKSETKSFLDQKKIRLATKTATEQVAPVQSAEPVSKKRRGKRKPAARSNPINNVAQPAAKDKTYFFKPRSEKYNNDKELEAYSAAACRFLAGPEYVSPVNAYFASKDKEGYKGVASRAMTDFKSNHDAPLQQADTIIECLKEPHLRGNLVGTAKLLRSYLEDERSARNKNDGMVEKFFNRRSVYTGDTDLHRYLEDMVNQLSDPAYHEAAREAAKILKFRLSSIVYFGEAKQVSKHLLILQSQLDEYIAQAEIGWPPYITIEDMEEAEKAVQQAGIDLAAMPDSEFVQLPINQRNVTFLARDLRNYSYVKGLAISLTTRHLMHEGDMNNTQFAKNGAMLDFGMTNLPIHKMLGDIEPRDLFLRQKHLDTIDFSERDFRHFPMLKDTQPYYWPTKKSFVSDILIDAISHYLNHYQEMKNTPADDLYQQITFIIKSVLEVVHEYRDSTNSTLQNLANSAMGFIMQLRAFMAQRDVKDVEAEDVANDLYGITNMLFNSYIVNHRKEIRGMEAEIRKELKLDANQFSAKDREVMRSLATHPVFDYFKFKTVLKYMLADVNVFEALANLYISPDKYSYSESNRRPLIDELVDREEEKIYAVYDLMIKMPEFTTFMSNHGDSAFDMIMREESALKERTMQKDAKHPGGHYKMLADAIDLPAIEERFQTIMSERLLKLSM